MCLLHSTGTRPRLSTDGIQPLLDTVNGAGWGKGHMTQSEPIGMFSRMHIGPGEKKLHKLINSHVFGSLSLVCLMATPKNYE